MDTISQHYVRMAFDMEQHIEGFVDAYFGPPELKEGGSPRPPADIVADIVALRATVQASDYPEQRRRYLDVQLRGMETSARKLAGEELSYRDEVRRCFDIEPTHTPEAVFEAAISTMDELLPGTGTVQERMEAWKKRYEVPPTIAQQMIERIAAEARARTAELVALPADEGVNFALVQDKPWSGYNWYLGAMRSLVEINTDLPIRANGLLDLVCHEAYPGHHTEHALKEQHLFRGQGWGEQSIQLINTPECVISEGIATLAADVIFGEDGAAWAAEQIYPLGGIVGDPERERQLGAASWALRALSGNAALLLHEQQADPEEVVQYIMRYGLRSEREARQSLRFISTPLWRAYIFTYHAGRELLSRWLDGGDRRERFRTLLTDQTYPSLVAGWLNEAKQESGRSL
jgi:hypothetical protein